jgi:hypothetical protein
MKTSTTTRYLRYNSPSAKLVNWLCLVATVGGISGIIYWLKRLYDMIPDEQNP